MNLNKKKIWKWTIVSIVSLIIVFFTMIYLSFISLFKNDEKASLEHSITINGFDIGLYRQEMWDATLWYVIRFKAHPPVTLSSPNGNLVTDGILLYTDASPNSAEPPVTLRKDSKYDILFCDKNKCTQIKSN